MLRCSRTNRLILDKSKSSMVEKQKVQSSSERGSRSTKVFVVVLCVIVGILLGFAIARFGFNVGSAQSGVSRSNDASASRPNFIIFLADDTGYGDFKTFGHPNQEWTGVDRMAEEGMALTHLYTPAPICSPSRAAILTGRYPVRTGVFGTAQVFDPSSSGGLPRREVTIPEALKERGYVTGITGKWHLGINKENNTDGYHLPKHHGFDAVNTILPLSQTWICNQHHSYVPEMSQFCFLYKNDEIVEQPINLGSLTSKLLNDTIDFLNKHKGQRFFYLMSFPQTHAALFSDPRFAGTSKRGPYGDNVNEMGWAINEVLDHLIKLGIESETLALFLSDHGAVRDGCGEEGSNGPFRGGKFTTWEGGVRVPGVAWWPGVIQPKSVSHSIMSTLDIFPTFMELADQNKGIMRTGQAIDGVSFADKLTKSQNISAPIYGRPLFFYCSDLLTAVRYRNYKIHYYISNRSNNDLIREGLPHCTFKGSSRLDEYLVIRQCRKNFVKQVPPLIFDVEADSEEHIFIDSGTPRYQELIKKMSKLIKNHEESIELVESEINKPHLPHLNPCCNPPTCMCNFEE